MESRAAAEPRDTVNVDRGQTHSLRIKSKSAKVTNRTKPNGTTIKK